MKVTYVEFLGQKHPLCFSLKAYEEVLDTFGSMDGLYAMLTSDNLTDIIQGLDKLLPILMRAGRLYASAVGAQLPPELNARPSDVLDARDPAALMTVIESIKNDTARTVETAQKNVEATPGA